MVAHLPVLPTLRSLPTTQPEINARDDRSTAHEFQSEDETVCVA
jgi:hypothetical protein